MASDFLKQKVQDRQEALKDGYTITIYDGKTGEKIGTEYSSGVIQEDTAPTLPLWKDPDMIWVTALLVSLLILFLAFAKLIKQIRQK